MKRILLGVFLSLSFFVQAQNWTGLNGPYGGTITDILVHPGGVYLTATSAGIFRSTDAGANWSRAQVSISGGPLTETTGTFADIEVDGNGKVFSAQANQLYISSDQGATFSLITPPGIIGAIKRLKVSPLDNNTIFAIASGASLFRSTDGGLSFTAVTSFGSLPKDLDITPAPAALVVVSTTSNGVQVSTTSAGDAFNASGSGISGNVNSLVISPTNASLFYALAADAPYRSADGGVTWASIKGTIADVGFDGTIDLDASENLIFMNNSSRKIYTSSNPTAGSPTWSGGVNYPNTNAIANCGYFKNSPNWSIGHSGYGFFSTSNSGTSWTERNKGIRGITSPKIFLSSTGRVFETFVGGLGYFSSADDGATWSLSNTGVAARPFYGFVKLSDNSILAHGPNGTVRSSNDGGSWTVQSASPAVSNPVSTANGVNLITYNAASLLTSSDQGVTWNTTTISGMTSTLISRVLIDGAGDAYILAANTISPFNIELYRVSNIIAAPTSAAAVKITNVPLSTIADIKIVKNVIYLIGTQPSNLLARSPDGGATWTSLPLPFTPAVTASSSGSATTFSLWVIDENNFSIRPSTAASFQISNDAGITWKSRPLLDPVGYATDMVTNTMLTAYVAVNNSVVHKSTVAIAIPGTPTGLTLFARGIDKGLVKYNDNTAAEQFYKTEISVGNNTSWQPYGSNINPVNTTSGVVADRMPLHPTIITYFRVYAVNTAGQSLYSNEVSGLALPVCAPASTDIPENRSWTVTVAADAGFTPTSPGSGTVLNQTLKLSTANNYVFPVLAAGMSIPVRGPVLVPPIPYVVSVSCGQTYFDNASGNSDLPNGNGVWDSSTGTLTIKWQINPSFVAPFKVTTTYTLNPVDPVPSTPSLLAFNYSNSQIYLNWSVSNFATQYVVERSITPGSGFAVAGTVNYPNVFYLDGGLTSGQLYYYRIKAVNGAGSSAYSPEVSIAPGNSLFSPVENNIALNFETQQGVSWGDLDGDGDEDVAVSSFTNADGVPIPPVFYENIGSNQFTRRDLAVLQSENTSITRGINIVDFNNDGKLDMYLTRSSSFGILDIVLINGGGWNFTKQSVQQTELWPLGQIHGASAADFDQDGKVDMFVGNESGVSGAATETGLLLRNVDGSTFTKITSGDIATNFNNIRTVAWADYDNDGDQDIFVTNNQGPTAVPQRLYKNNGNGNFTLVTGLVFDSDTPLNQLRTVSWGDIDNDGDMDLYLGSSVGAEVDRLYRNNTNGTSFTRLTGSAVEETGTATFGSSFGDIDNDGDLDLIVVNSAANSIFINDGTGAFTKSSTLEMLTNANIVEAGGSMVDFDKDGDLDFYPAKGAGSLINLPNLLYSNNLGATGFRRWLEIKLVGTVSNKAAIGARIKVVTNIPARSQIREVSASTGYGSQNSLIQHFGLLNSPIANQVIVTWPNGGVQTFTNINANQIVTLTEDVTGPTMVFTPLNGAVNVPLGTTIDITLNEAATKVTGKKITIRSGSATATPLQVIDISAGVAGAGNKFTFTLAASTNFLTTYFISVDAGAFLDDFSNASLNVAATAWTFTTADQPDVTKPGITFTPPVTFDKGFGTSQKFEVIATDNKAVTSVIMYYRKTTATTTQQLTGVLNATTTKYDFPLQESFFDDMGLEYYFEAKDAASNSVTSPAAANAFHFTRLKYTASNTGIPISAGSTVNDFQIRSVPYELGSNQINILFDELGAPDIKQWRMFKYRNAATPDWDEYPANFNAVQRGEAYFIISRVAQNVKLGDVNSPNYTQSNPFVMNLKQGWNLIGNPYTMTADWEASRSGFASVGKLKSFSGGAYIDDTDGNMGLFEGGFVLAQADVVVPVKFKTSINGGRIGNTISSSRLDQNEWIVPIMVMQGENTFMLGGVGMHPNAKVSYDGYDDFAPPALFESVEMRFGHPEHFMKNFALDVVNTQPDYTWEFDIDVNSTGITELQWSNTDFGENSKDIYLHDESRDVIIDMRKQTRYSFDPKRSASFRIYYGQELEKTIKPNSIVLGDPYPNPSDGLISIPFTLSEKSDNYDVRLDVYDMLGKKVTTLAEGQFKPGFYTSVWDTERSGTSSGLYTFRLVVSSDNQSEVQAGKVIIKK